MNTVQKILRSTLHLRRCYCTSAQNKTTIIGQLEVSDKPIYQQESEYTDEELAVIRNKSRLYRKHHRMLNGKSPDENDFWFQRTEKYKRRMLGRYGLEACNVSPGVAWPSKETIEDQLEYEKVYMPYTIQEGWKIIAEKKATEKRVEEERQEHVDKQMSKVSMWRAQLQAKLDKKEAEIREAKERKERMMEDVRAHFGFTIDPRDDRFQALMEQKEKEEKKKKKEAKKKKQSEEVMAKLLDAEKELRLRKKLELEKAMKEDEEEPKAAEKAKTTGKSKK